MHGEENKTIYELIRALAERAPEPIAIRAPGRCDLTYGGLLEQVNGVVKFMNGGGISPGDRVGIVLPNGPEMAAAFLGVAAVAACAPLNPAYTADEFEFYLSDLDLRALIVQAGMSSAVSAIAEKHGIPVIELLPRLEGAAGTFTLRGDGLPVTLGCGFPKADDVALILSTSGTTSRPKLVPLTHANLLASS